MEFYRLQQQHQSWKINEIIIDIFLKNMHYFMKVVDVFMIITCVILLIFNLTIIKIKY